MAAKGDDLVLVTGASGFIATHVVQQLLQKGYRVRGTVRDTKNERKVAPLRSLCPEAKNPLELVEADLNDPGAWSHAVTGCDYVIHVASPLLNVTPKNENDIIKPAVEGTRAIMKAAAESGSVKRVVLTSSTAAINAGGFVPMEGLFSEDTWPDLDKVGAPYVKSKTLAERAAWDYVKDLPTVNGRKLELAVINPGYVVGPVLCGEFATAMEIPKRLLEHKMPAVPRLDYVLVDVRDVAEVLYS